jgi:hypothetical protein
MSTDDVRTTHTIIPASPGWYVAKFCEVDLGQRSSDQRRA